ncbi:MAG: helix-turn-helix domain-containing protein [Defluviitaleaceae bacterium]|nr:helix-turn-helix domain-containing protein [Defluviitaleaceae bacterium]
MAGAYTSKQDEMRNNGSFNHRAAKVNAKIFKNSPFFDAHDLMQVKYEMLRAVEKDKREVTSACAEFGFSRVSFYQIKKEYDESGIAGLMPKKRGPKGSRKISASDVEFARSLVDTHTKAQIVSRLKEERGVEISKRTLERQLSVKKNS